MISPVVCLSRYHPSGLLMTLIDYPLILLLKSALLQLHSMILDLLLSLQLQTQFQGLLVKTWGCQLN